MSDSKPVVIRFADGSEYGVASVEIAQRVYPAAEIVRYQDGQPIDETAIRRPNLSAMTRRELNAYAASVGVEDPDTLPNMAAVIAAIEGVE